ncbi:MAG: FAD-binding protein [Clostridiales bacterium]|nr:FAD-binding protein [Clostridiales bacterium]
MDQEVITALQNMFGDSRVLYNSEDIYSYTRDYTFDSLRLICPEPAADGCIVVKPENTAEVSALLKYAGEKKIPVIPRGGGTGIAAGAIPTEPSIIVSMERMNKVLELDEENLMITCEPAVSLHDLVQLFSQHEKLYFPLHPGDESAQVGGMVSTNAGGVNAVRYGVMRDQVKGLEVVLPTGEILTLGGRDGKLVKNNAGYDIMHLFIGSEGTLGIITKATLRLVPKSKASGTLIVSFKTRKDAFAAVPKIIQEGIIPVALEYIEKEQILRTAAVMNKTWPAKEGFADLMIVLSEDSNESIYSKGMAIEEICSQFNMISTIIAQEKKEQRNILEIRSHLFPAIEKDVCDVMDATVPRSRLNEFIEEVDKLAARYHTTIPLLAHAGDGNLHTFILRENNLLPDYYLELKTEFYKIAVELGGTITGEHGVGLLRRKDMSLQFSEKEQDIMRQIKKVFDPENILNPGKKI